MLVGFIIDYKRKIEAQTAYVMLFKNRRHLSEVCRHKEVIEMTDKSPSVRVPALW